MKKFIVSTFFFFSLVCLNAVPSFAHTEGNIERATSERSSEQLINRLHEIKDMDRSSLSKAEKKELRKEVKEIKEELKEERIASGVYISGGAILIAVILLLFLL